MEHLVRDVAATGVAGASIVFRVHCLRKNNGTFVSQLFNQQMVASRKVDVVPSIAATGRAHILGVEPILKRKCHPIHRHFFYIKTASVLSVELCGTLKRIGQMAKILADRRRAWRKRPFRGM